MCCNVSEKYINSHKIGQGCSTPLKKMFIQNTTYVNLLLFLHCVSRLEHVGLNKYFWHRAYLQSYNDVFHNASYSTGGGGWGQHFFNSEGVKINDSLGPPGVRPPGYAPVVPSIIDRLGTKESNKRSSVASPICQEGQSERNFPIFAFSSWFFLFFPDFSWFFPSFWQIFHCQRWHSAPLATPMATPLNKRAIL